MNISFLTTLKGKKMTALKKMILFFYLWVLATLVMLWIL